MLIDTHAHYDIMLSDSMFTMDELLSGRADAGLSASVQVSISPEGFQWSRKFAASRKDKKVYFTAGIHPSSPAGDEELSLLRLFVEEAAASEDVHLLFGIGECGLDFYRKRRPSHEQRKSFEYQISLAREFGLPVIIHSRDAMKETVEILKAQKPDIILMHCFPGDSKDASKLLDLGAYISYAGNLTYPKAHALHDSCRYIPIDRLLFETDSPFLAPVPHRGKKNTPDQISHTVEFAAALRKKKPDWLIERVYENFENLTGNLKKAGQNISS